MRSAAVAAPLSAELLSLPWRKASRADEEITDEIEFAPRGSATYRHILDTNDELVAIVCVESVDDSAAADLKARLDIFLAAPDLLDALKAMTALQNYRPTQETMAAFQAARAAIAKAEGKQP